MRINREVTIYLLIYKFRNGYQKLSQMNWNSVSGVYTSVAALLGVTGFLLAIRDGRMGNLSSLPWFSERRNVEKLLFVPGLQNLGNNCFLNVILQALASCSCFQSYLRKIMEEGESWAIDEQLESFPFTVSLAALLKELCSVRDGKTVLSPQKVMLAMNMYIPSFNLTCQQDAAEALLHLLSSLRGEISESFVPIPRSLADISAFPNFRILNPMWMENRSVQKRWQRHYLGPFDGILCSTLTCQSCSSEIIMDFEFFHSLPLSPVLGGGGTIMAGCALEDCLKSYIAAEQIENYHCNRCWHIAATKYLLSVDGSEAEIGQIQSCGLQDSCRCRKLSRLKALPLSNRTSWIIKQLSIARCPKILCIYLQRASANVFGELVKLQGHISFPLILNLLPFMKNGVGIKNWDKNMPRGQGKLQYQCLPYVDQLNLHFDTRILNRMYVGVGENVCSETLPEKELGCTTSKFLDKRFTQVFQGESSLPNGLDTTPEDMPMQYDDKVGPSSHLVPLDAHMYHLVSVVEHFGRTGSGHYTVFRKMRAMLEDEDHNGQPMDCWFSISDSEVFSVSEKDVLSAEASLLFYERISEG